MAAIKIRIGASLDRSADVPFATLEKRAKLAARVIQRELGKVWSGGGSGAGKSAAAGADLPAKKAIEAQRKATVEISHEFKKRVAYERALDVATHREKLRLIRVEAQAKYNAEKRQARQLQREQARELDRFATRTSHRATRFLTPNAPIGSAAARTARDFAAGAGVDFNLGSSVQRSVELQRSAIDLSNQSAISGKRTPASELIGLSRGVGEKLAMDPSQIMGGLRQFAGKTGDLDTAKKLLEPLARLSVATGSNFEDMGDAAGFVAMQLGDIPDKATAVVDVIRSMAAQGAIGSVEMRDMATQMGRIAAHANKFQGNRGENIKKLGALAQLSIASGGATSAADAARSVASFGNTFGKSARIKAFQDAGVDLFTDKSQTQMRDPFEIIKDSFRKTNGNIPQISNMFADTLGRKPINALGGAFNQAGGGEAGIAAVDRELKKFANATVDATTEAQNVEEYLNGTGAKAQKFQNQLDRVVGVLADRVFPELEKAGPAILKAAKTFADIGAWAVENPSKAIGAAIAVSITRASVESALRAGIEGAIKGTMGGTAGKPGGSGVMGGLMTAGSAIAIASMAVTTFQAGKLIIDELFKKDEKQQESDAVQDANLGATLGGVRSQSKSGAISPEMVEELRKRQSELTAKLERADERDTKRNLPAGALNRDDAAGGAMIRFFSELFGGEADKRLENEALRKDLQEVQSLLDQIKSGTLKVQVTNMPAAGASEPFVFGVDQPGRAKNGIQ